MTAPPQRPAPTSRDEFRAQLREQIQVQAAIAARRPPRKRPNVFPRALPWDSPVSRLWAGTKVLALLALTSVLLWAPRWPTIGLVLALLVIAMRVARVPRSVVPRIPFIVWWAMLWGGISSAVFGGLEEYVRTCALGLVVLLASFVLLWTTRAEHLTPAFTSLLAPLRLVRAPVDDWGRTMGLSLRGMPVVTRELQSLHDASRLRGGWQRRLRGRTSVWARYRALLAELGDLMTAALSASERRATATGRAMTMRGGLPPLRRGGNRPGLGDVVAVLLTAGVVAGSLLLR